MLDTVRTEKILK